MAYAMFQYLGKSWIESKFAERLEALKHDQAIELRRLRVQIESMLSGTLKLQELEFKVLPEAWSKLDQAYALLRWSTSSLQQYPTLDGMGHTDLLLDPIKKVHGGDKNWATTAKLRDQPEVLQRRFRKSSAVSQLSNPISQTTQGSPRSRVGTVLHARIHSADESSRTFEADLDETGGLDYKASQKHFANPPLHVHAPGVKDGERGPHVARLTSTFRHDKSKKSSHERKSSR